MGAWGTGGFENDTAADFAADIRSIDDIRFVIGSEPPRAPIDSDQACRIIAAAECVAAMLGRPPADMPQELRNRVAKFGKPDTALLESARGQVSAVISGSELGELWAESEDPSLFKSAMTGLIDRLNPAIKSAKPRGRKKPAFNASPCGFCNQPMGEAAFSMFEITISLGDDVPMRIGKWAHLECLNRKLHPNHIVQQWR